MTEFFEFLRARDLLNVEVELINLTLDTAAATPVLRRRGTGTAAIVLRLPGQHIAEESALEGATPPTLPYRSFLSRPSRLTFHVGDTPQDISFRLADILDLLTFATPPLTFPSSPDGLPSLLEFPDQLLLTPSSSPQFVRQRHPSDEDAWVPIWHMRIYPGERRIGFLAIRNPRDRERFTPPARSTLNKGHRSDIATYSERDRFNLVMVEDLLLTSLGATAKLAGDWRDAPDLQLRRWSQTSILGRDSHVETTERGFLFPFGHRASLTTITQRQVTAGVAGLVSHPVVVVEEPERSFAGGNAAVYPHGGREMPFRSVRIAPHKSFAVGPDGRVDVSAIGQDWRGNEVTFSVAMFFVALGDANNAQKLDELERRFRDNALVGVSGQRMALASDRRLTPPALASGPSDTEVTVDQLGFRVERVPLGGSVQPPFLPAVQTARISLPAIEQYLGSSSGAIVSAQRGWVRMEFHPKYLQDGFSPQNPRQVYASFLDRLPGLNVPADRSGGLSAPKFPPIDGLSRMTGPVAGVRGLVEDTMISARELVGGTKLLGTIELASLIADVRPSSDGIQPAEFAQIFDNLDRLPPEKSITQPILTTVQTPAGLETRFVWKPQMKPPAAGSGFEQGSGGKLQLALKGRVLKTAAGSTFDVDGALKNFKLKFLDLLTLDFGRLAFQSRAGAKMRMEVDINGFEFGPGLNFVSSILPLLKQAGLGSGFQIEPQPDGIRARFGIGIPSFSLGAAGLENIAVSSTISLPFVPDKPAAVRIALSERSKPFLVSVAPFGGTGFFALEANTDRVMRIEAAIEFGGVLSINLLGIVKGGIYAFAGIYVCIEAQGTGASNQIAGFVRWGGYADVLGIISASIEFYVELKYQPATHRLSAAARLTIGVRFLFFSKTFSFTIQQEIANFGALPGGIASLPSPFAARSFASAEQWQKYCAAFA